MSQRFAVVCDGKTDRKAFCWDTGRVSQGHPAVQGLSQILYDFLMCLFCSVSHTHKKPIKSCSVKCSGPPPGGGSRFFSMVKLGKLPRNVYVYGLEDLKIPFEACSEESFHSNRNMQTFKIKNRCPKYRLALSWPALLSLETKNDCGKGDTPKLSWQYPTSGTTCEKAGKRKRHFVKLMHHETPWKIPKSLYSVNPSSQSFFP